MLKFITGFLFFSFLLCFISIIHSCNQPFSQGEALYKNYCANCHGFEGLGLKSLYPPIANSDYLEDNFEKLPCLIRNGIEKPLIVNGKQYKTPMAGIPELNDVELTNISNFIASQWYPNKEYISLKDINMIIVSCKK